MHSGGQRSGHRCLRVYRSVDGHVVCRWLSACLGVQRWAWLVGLWGLRQVEEG